MTLVQRRGVKGTLRLGFGQNVPPGAQVMQRNAMIAQGFDRLWEDVVIEDHRRMRAGGAGVTDGVDEGQL